MATNDYNAKHEAVLAREERKFEKAKAKAEAAEQNMTRTLAGLLKQQSVKKTLARDAMAATKDPSRADKMFDIAAQGTHQGEDETITGINMERPWED